VIEEYDDSDVREERARKREAKARLDDLTLNKGETK
jgi:hypothetical protein